MGGDLVRIQFGYETGDNPGAPANIPELPRALEKILFSPETPAGEIFSPRVTVSPGEAILVTGYNLPEDRSIYLNRVSVGSYAVPHGEPCDYRTQSARPRDGVDLFTGRMVLGKPEAWILSTGRPQMILPVPGRYRFELEDEDMLGGDMQVDYIKWELTDTFGLPWGTII